VRIRLISPVLGALLVAGGLAAMVALPSHAEGPMTLYFHSANNGYGGASGDVSKDPTAVSEKRAPKGSTMDTVKPNRNSEFSATWYAAGNNMPGALFQPSWVLPEVSAPVAAMCVDVWVSDGIPAQAATDLDLVVSLSNGIDAPVAAPTIVVKPNPGGTVHVTSLVKFAKPITLPKTNSSLLIGSTTQNGAAGLTLTYEGGKAPATTSPSNVTFNPETCGGAAPLPTTTATATATATSSATPTATPTATGTATPTATPTGSGTPTPTVLPTNEAGQQETSTEYTGPASGRYDGSVPLSAKVTTPDGAPVPTGSVAFTLGSQTVAADVAPDGTATATLRVRSTAGGYVMRVEFQPSEAFATSAQQVPFTVVRMPTRCLVTHQLTSRGMVLTGTFKDANGKLLAGQPIVFTFNGKTYKTVTSGSNGKASATLPAGHGTYATALRAGSRYAGCSASYKA
jgi:hypothetical protein